MDRRRVVEDIPWWLSPTLSKGDLAELAKKDRRRDEAAK